MKSSEKRTKTEPGLGKAASEGRSTTSRARMAFDADRATGPITPPPISAPPPLSDPPGSNPPISAGTPRHTRPVETPASLGVTESNDRLVIEPKELSAAASNERLMIERRDTDLAVKSRPGATLAGAPIARGDSAPPQSQPFERVERIERESSPPTEHRTERIDLFLDHGSRGAPGRSRPVTFRSDGRDDGPSPSQPADTFKDETGTGKRPAPDARTGSRTVDGKPIGGTRSDSASDSPAGRSPGNRAGNRASTRPSSRPPVGNRAVSSSPAPNSGRPAANSGRPAANSGRPAANSGRPAANSGRPAPTTSARPAPAPTSSRPTLREDPPAATADSGAPRRGGIARSARPSIREDNVGSAVNRAPDAVGLAGRAIPRLLKTKSEIAAAPIDHRAGFLLSYIDGTTSVQGLVDIAAMPEEDVHEILERLRRLGIVSIR